MKVEQKSMLEDLCHALKILLLEEKAEFNLQMQQNSD